MNDTNATNRDIALGELERFVDSMASEPLNAHLDTDTLPQKLQPLARKLQQLACALGEREAADGVSSTPAGSVDPLTGLLRASDFLRSARICMNEQKDTRWCIAAIDLGHLHLFNEWHGKRAGDELLSRIGKELREFAHDQHAAAGYWGQDDFSVLAPLGNGAAEKLYYRVCGIVDSFDDSTGFLPSMGIYCLDTDEIVGINQYDRAIFAIKEAKRGLNERLAYFSPTEYRKTQEEQNLLLDFQQALARGQIEFYLQPQAELATGKLAGAEALTRWRDGDGFVPPDAFIPALEKTGFIVMLDMEIWRQVFSWMGERLQNGQQLVPISINVSRIDIQNLDVAQKLIGMIDGHSIPHEFVKIEITESAYTDDQLGVTALVNKLHAEGFTVLMDDFGAGQSSLSMLKSVPVDVIKLDSGFMRRVDATGPAPIVESVMRLAHALDIPVIAEGVETQEQVDLLTTFGCSYIQGYYYARPMPAQEFGALIDASENSSSFVKSR